MERHRRRHQLALGALAVVLIALMTVGSGTVFRGNGTDDASGPAGGSVDSSWDESHDHLVEKEVGPGRMSVRESEKDIESCATDVLAGYRDARDCVLVRSGYLDLSGSVWSCTVRHREGVEICFVCQRADGGSDVRVLRMEESEWRDLGGLAERLSASRGGVGTVDD